MKTQDYKKIIRREGIKMSRDISTRIRGWSNSTEGVYFSHFPWVAYQIYKGWRLKCILPDRTQEMTISECKTETELEKVKNLFKREKINFTDDGNVIRVEIENPFSEEEVKKEEERNQRLRKIIRQ
jgi:hypothetical protein